MNDRSTLRIAAALAVAALSSAPLAGCSGALPVPPGGSPLPPASSARSAAGPTFSAASPDRKKKKAKTLLYVSDVANNAIDVFEVGKTKRPHPIRTITKGIQTPNGIATDETGNLYVTNYNANALTIYAPNTSTPERTITKGLNGPLDVKVDGSGNIYVANVPFYASEVGAIEKYAEGSSTPSATWYLPATVIAFSGIALLNADQPGETSIYAMVYSEQSSYDTSAVFSCYPGYYICGQVGNTLSAAPGGIAVTQSPGGSQPFQYLVVDQYVPGVLDFTQNGGESQIQTGGLPRMITMNEEDTDFFVADQFAGQVEEYSFPAGKLVNAFPVGNDSQLYGVATFPSGTFH
ncbi:MAG TPA: hypothetical protein VGX91_06435 [Candidatus Cybelea sp.]|jgi:hypothetical protein|nr:hypothetical protein [Candidatus Cybelea sp.]